MLIRWNNGVLKVGYLDYCQTYGVELAWGRRDILEGEPTPVGERIFADHKVWHVVTMKRLMELGLR